MNIHKSTTAVLGLIGLGMYVIGARINTDQLQVDGAPETFRVAVIGLTAFLAVASALIGINKKQRRNGASFTFALMVVLAALYSVNLTTKTQLETNQTHLKGLENEQKLQTEQIRAGAIRAKQQKAALHNEIVQWEARANAAAKFTHSKYHSKRLDAKAELALATAKLSKLRAKEAAIVIPSIPAPATPVGENIWQQWSGLIAMFGMAFLIEGIGTVSIIYATYHLTPEVEAETPVENISVADWISANLRRGGKTMTAKELYSRYTSSVSDPAEQSAFGTALGAAGYQKAKIGGYIKYTDIDIAA